MPERKPRLGVVQPRFWILDFGFKNPHKFTRLIRGFKAFEFLGLLADKMDDKISFVPQISGTDQDYEEGPATIWVIVNPKG